MSKQITFTVAFEIGEIVYKVIDRESHPHQVIGYLKRQFQTLYILEDQEYYYEFELTTTPSFGALKN